MTSDKGRVAVQPAHLSPSTILCNYSSMALTRKVPSHDEEGHKAPPTQQRAQDKLARVHCPRPAYFTHPLDMGGDSEYDSSSHVGCSPPNNTRGGGGAD